MGGVGSSMDARRWIIAVLCVVVIAASGVWLLYTSGVIGSHPAAYDPLAGLSPEERTQMIKQQNEAKLHPRPTKGS